MERRQLTFDNLDQVVEDARALLNSGYTAVGKWQLSQVCEHLADWMTFPVDGFPKKNPLVRSILWILKKTIGGPKALGKMLAENKMKAGVPTDPGTVHSLPDHAVQFQLDQAAVERLAAATERFNRHQGPIYSSPIYGDMDKPTAEHLQRIHCALHLSFLQPKTEA